MDPTLWNLCQRDQLLALRDQVRKQHAAGNAQAGHVVTWMERILAGGTSVATAFTTRRAFVNRASAAPAPHRFHHRAPAPMRTQ